MKKIFFALSLIITVAITAQERDSYEVLAAKRFALFQYKYAIPVFEKLVLQKKANPLWFYQLGYCYQSIDDYKNAAKNYVLFTQKDTANRKELFVQIGDLYKMAEMPDSALTYYTKSKNEYGAGKRIEERIKSISLLTQWVKNPSKYIISNAKGLNSILSDWGASYFKADSVVFMSDYTKSSLIQNHKSINAEDYKWNGNHFYKLYVANKSLVSSDDWREPTLLKSLSKNINQSKFHIGPIVFTKNYDTAYYTQTYSASTNKELKFNTRLSIGARRLELFQTTRDNNGNWANPVKLTFNNKDVFNNGHAALNKEGNILYFASDMPGGFGKTDIWFVEKNTDGTWGTPINCGATINTIDEEAYPTFSEDNKLFFASTGHVGMGGFDIFFSNGTKTTWQNPVNMKYPVNSMQDDFYWSMNKTNQQGFLSSNRIGGMGNDDIYTVAMPIEENKPFVTKEITAKILAVKLLDKATKAPIEDGYITLKNLSTGNNYEVISTKKYSTFPITKSDQYRVLGNKISWEMDSLTLANTTNNDTLYVSLLLSKKQVIAKEQPKNKIEEILKRFTGLKTLPPNKGDWFILKNFYYDLDKYNIRSDASLILDTLVILMNYYPTLEIELSSHTDSRASNAYNNLLSKNRANAAVAYLIKSGVAAKRIIARGYGEEKLINRCKDNVPCSEPEHQLNRRTEVLITKY